MKADKAIEIAKNVLQDETNGLSEQLEEVLETFISIAKLYGEHETELDICRDANTKLKKEVLKLRKLAKQQEVDKKEIEQVIKDTVNKGLFDKKDTAEIIKDQIKALKDKFVMMKIRRFHETR